jgi:hypothetical protein
VAETAPAEPYLEETYSCRVCGGAMEPEEDGNLHYFSCTDCGFDEGWAFQKITTPGCQLGVPEDIRRRAQVPQAPEPVFLGTSIGRRP